MNALSALRNGRFEQGRRRQLNIQVQMAIEAELRHLLCLVRYGGDMQLVLWQERATLSRYLAQPGSSGASRETILEGSLADIVATIELHPRDLRTELLILLPDRFAPPNRYGPENFDDLIGRFDRPAAP